MDEEVGLFARVPYVYEGLLIYYPLNESSMETDSEWGTGCDVTNEKGVLS